MTERDTLSFRDDLGPLKVIQVHVPKHGVEGILVVDNVAAGPSIGGLRMAPDVTARECFRLARAMTLKNAAAGLSHGGGKSVLVGDPAMPRAAKEAMIRAFAHALKGEEHYIFGPDMGTDEHCMAWIKDEIGRAAGLPRELGGIPLDELGATGYGLAAAADVAIAHCDFTLDGARLAVQGFGSVGLHAARFLAEKGVKLVAAADSRGTVYNPDGLDVDALVAHKRSGGRVADFAGGQALDRDAVNAVDCDIWIPAARPDVVTMENMKNFKAKLVLQGANIPIQPEAEAALDRRGVVIVPDFIANAGGVICAAMEYHGASEVAAFSAIAEKIARNTREVLERARTDGVTSREAAVALAVDRVRAAMDTRANGIF
ncbi:MAG: Glu/Leu/Phe/Val dehydrogenase [Alphaproteobacteria bacterium]|nr:Glu/Leu/Phe/Val dehydrogenase [Alphaproteobacteria bacterium]